MEPVCYIVGACPPGPMALVPGRPALIIAADQGLRHLEAAGIVPDLIVGDFDSLGEVPSGKNVIRHPVEKDDTDMLLALKEGLRRGYEEFVLLGSLGGRLDHTAANIQAVAWGLQHGAFVLLADENNLVTMLQNDSARIPRLEGYHLSLCSYTGRCRGVTVWGVKYPLEGACLDQYFPLGVSNEIEAAEAFVQVDEGILLIVMSREG